MRAARWTVEHVTTCVRPDSECSSPPDLHRLSTAFRKYGNVSAADASRLAALLVGQMHPAFFLLAPGEPGASTPEYVTVLAKCST